MKAIIIMCVCLALLPFTVSAYYNLYIEDLDEELNKAHNRLEEILRNGSNVRNLFKPSAFLGKGSYSVSYLGKMLRTNKTVAMKFSPTFKEDIEHEYAMYTYLGAINNPKVENYGIPAVYYYGKWENCSMIAITPLDPQFKEIVKDSEKISSLSDVDFFIICREYVITSKFIHSRGVCHGDSHTENFMFRGNKGFVIDFNLGIILTECIEDCRNEDWRQFITHICDVFRIGVDWRDPMNTFRNIENLQRTGLKRVLLELARSTYQVRLDYDRIFEIISAEIKNTGVQEPAIVSWLTTETQKLQAIAEWERLPTSHILFIKSIPNPFPINLATQFSYPTPNYSYFERD